MSRACSKLPLRQLSMGDNVLSRRALWIVRVLFPVLHASRSAGIREQSCAIIVDRFCLPWVSSKNQINCCLYARIRVYLNALINTIWLPRYVLHLLQFVHNLSAFSYTGVRLPVFLPDSI